MKYQQNQVPDHEFFGKKKRKAAAPDPCFHRDKLSHSGELLIGYLAPDGHWVTLAVQDEISAGQRLDILIDIDDDRMRSEFPHRIIKPALVAELIRKAIHMGWKPKNSASPLELTLDEQDELVIRRGLL